MEIDRAELKHQAKERMAIADPKFWVIALAYIAMTTGVTMLVSLIPSPSAGPSPLPAIDTFRLFFQLLLRLYTVVVNFGLCLWALWTYRQLNPGLNSLMQGFSVAGRVLLMELGIFLRTMGWYFLVASALSVPVIVLMVSSASAGVGMTVLLLYFIALIITLIILSLRYALAPYLLADRPDDGPSASIYRSVTLMRRWKMDLFKLELSFIGWEAINFVLSAGVILFFLFRAGLLTTADIGSTEWLLQWNSVIYSTPVTILSSLVTIPVSLWLIPYRQTARAGFYDARLLAASQDEHPQPEMPPL